MTGGIDGAAAFAIANTEFGNLESSTPVFSNGRVTLKREVCEVTGDAEFFDNVYAYKLDGAQLSFKTVSNRCADKIAETILTSRAWTKQN